MSLNKQLFNFANTRDCVVSTPAKLKPLGRMFLLTCQKSPYKKKLEFFRDFGSKSMLSRKYCQKCRVFFFTTKSSRSTEEIRVDGWRPSFPEQEVHVDYGFFPGQSKYCMQCSTGFF